MEAERLLRAATAEAHELVGRSIERLSAEPSPLDFLRQYVATNRPVVVCGGAAGWPCLRRWSDAASLRAAAGGGAQLVTVSLTPDGRGDAVKASGMPGVGRVFALPCEQRWPLASVLDELSFRDDDQGPPCVPYVSAQDGSLGRDFPFLAQDLPASLAWAEAALGPPEAVNLWLGDARATTTFHSDPYENLYAVVAGRKRFLLLPPSDGHRLYLSPHPRARHARAADGSWTLLEEEGPPVLWSPVDAEPEGAEARKEAALRFPRFFHGPPPLEVLLEPGDILYLPAGWWHQVSQSDWTVAVNWWHEALLCPSTHALLQLAEEVARIADAPGAEPAPPAVLPPAVEGEDAELEATRRSWNFATAQHEAHKQEQAAHILAAGTLFPEELALMGGAERLSGARVLHLLCNAGQDSLSLAARGAQVTGVDISDVAIAAAERLREQTSLPARFARAEAINWLESRGEEGDFDIVFASYGALPWLADLPRLMRAAARALRPGGSLVIQEIHPLVWSFDARFCFSGDPYFAPGRPFVDPVSDYVAAAGGALSPSGHVSFASEPNPFPAVAWQHTLAEVVSAVLAAGLRLEALREHDYSNGCCSIAGLVAAPGRRFVVPSGTPSPPLMYGLAARRE
jgi:SAM-dependent methyltransferase